MHPALKHFRSFLDALADLVDGVRGNIDINRPRFAAPGVGKRLRAGIRLIEVYLRRVLLVLALKLEPDLVHNPGALRDSKRSVLCERGPVFRVLLDQYLSRHDRAELREMARERRLGWGHDPRPAPHRVFMVPLYRRIDKLAAIAADPLKRARSLAWRLARQRAGILIAPDLRFRPAGCVRRYWRTETGITFVMLGQEILVNSRTRPPPLPPRQRRGPTPRIRILHPPGPWPEWLPGAQGS